MQPSSVAEIAEVRKVVELPEPGPSGPIRVEIRKVHAAVLLAKVGTMPSFSPSEAKPGTMAEVARLITESDKPMRAVAEAVLVSPPFSFGEAPEDGRAWWGALSWPNQVAVMQAGMDLAGLAASVKASPDGGAAREAVRFHGSKAGQSGTGGNGIRPRGGRKRGGK